MPLTAGERLGPYEILVPIGAGGMGEVYKARDTRLGRDVAIKVSAEQFSDRFEREARAVAALNHPHICTLHDVGPNYLVMEYIEGAPLRGPMPPEKALPLALQVVGAICFHCRLSDDCRSAGECGCRVLLDGNLDSGTGPESSV